MAQRRHDPRRHHRRRPALSGRRAAGQRHFDTGAKTSQFKLIGALSDVDSAGTTFQGAELLQRPARRRTHLQSGALGGGGVLLAAGPPTVTAHDHRRRQRPGERGALAHPDLQPAGAARPRRISLSLLDNTGTNPPTDISSNVLGTPTTTDGGKTWLVRFNAGTANSDASGSLCDGAYRLTVHAAGVTAAGQTMTGDYTATFHRLFGDTDGNGSVNALDYARFKQAFGTSSAVPATTPPSTSTPTAR